MTAAAVRYLILESMSDVLLYFQRPRRGPGPGGGRIPTSSSSSGAQKPAFMRLLNLY